MQIQDKLHRSSQQAKAIQFHEDTFIVRWWGREEGIFQRIQKAFKRWVDETPEGKKALADAGGALRVKNLIALQNILSRDDHALPMFLQGEGVFDLEVTIQEKDYKWLYHTSIVE